MTEREERIARNEALFRDLNERLKEITESLTAGDNHNTLELFCECGTLDCMEKIRVPVQTYERVRAVPERFLVAPGHDHLDVERVVERLEKYWLVEKHEEEAEIARQTNPRRAV
jgi:hypothetical protein